MPVLALVVVEAVGVSTACSFPLGPLAPCTHVPLVWAGPVTALPVRHPPSPQVRCHCQREVALSIPVRLPVLAVRVRLATTGLRQPHTPVLPVVQELAGPTVVRE